MDLRFTKSKKATHAGGYSLVELMIVLGLVGIASLASWIVLHRMTLMRLDAMSFASMSSESRLLTQHVKRRFLTRVGGNNGVCAASAPFMANPAPGIGYCLSDCTTGTTGCKTFSIRRGSAALFEDVSWQTQCVTASTATSARLPSGTNAFPSQCGLNCPAGQIPRVLITTRKVPTPGTPTTTTRIAPGGAGLAGAAQTLSTSIGAELCMSLRDGGVNTYGSVLVTGRVYGFGMGDTQTRRVRFEDSLVAFPELVLANDSLIFQVTP